MLIKNFVIDRIILLFFLSLLFPSISSKNNEDVIVHIIPHTHDDAGWLWTLDQYYFGTDGARASVKNILDSFVDSLFNNKERTFTYVEMAFFIKWYKQQTEIIKNKVKQLINEKRFEFINGGYVMHDEAGSYYQHSIDQMRLGLLFLNQEFNYVPEIAWFIDPFGHSASNAYILAKMGFKKIVLVRIDYKEKDYRKAKKELEFYWVPFGQIDESTKIFTHITHDHYNTPAGMEDFLNDKPLNMSPSEIEMRSQKIIDAIKNMNSKYLHRNHLLMYGDDFTHNKADANFLNIEKIMEYINSKDLGMKLKYSTPTKYFEAIFEQVQTWPYFKNQDFFPYADGEYAYWTGYFTSRPYLKGLIREAGNYLSGISAELFNIMINNSNLSSNVSVKKIQEIKQIIETNIEKLFDLREKLAVCQHHDAVAGTARELVSKDYITMLELSLKNSKDAFGILYETYNSMKNFTICFDPVIDYVCQKNIFNFDSNKQRNLKVNTGEKLFSVNNNPLKNFYYDSDYDIKEVDGGEDHSEIFCVDDLKGYIPNCQVYFNNITDYVISKSNHKQRFLNSASNNSNKNFLKKEQTSKYIPITSNKQYLSSISLNMKKEYDLTKNLKLINTRGLLKFNLKTKLNNYDFEIFHAFYLAYNGGNSDLRPFNSNPSGAYILSTTKLNYDKFNIDYEKSYVEQGKDITRVVFRFEKSYLILTVNKNSTSPNIQMESVWDPIDINGEPKEYLLIVKSDVENTITLPDGRTEPEFWTDSNGIKMMRRIKDFRQHYNYTITEKLASNFYPVNSMFSILERSDVKFNENDYENINYNAKRITLLNDRAQSGGAMDKGEIIMIHNRHSNNDDRRGLSDGVYEKASFDSYFKLLNYLIFDSDDQNIKNVESSIQERFSVFASDFEAMNEIKLKKSTIHNLISGLENKNIIFNMHLLGNNKVFVQFLNNCDRYFINKCNSEFIEFQSSKNIKYSLSEFQMNGTSKLSDIDLVKNHKVEIKPFDFKLFKFEF